MNAQQKNAQVWGNQPIDSVSRLLEALTFIEAPHPPMEAINILLTSSEKQKFIKALEETLGVNGQLPSKETTDYLRTIISFLSQGKFTEAIRSLGYGYIPPEVMLDIAKTNGVAFRNAVKSAVSPTDPMRDVSLSLVESTLESVMDKFDYPLEKNAPTITHTQMLKTPSPAPAQALADSASLAFPSSPSVLDAHPSRKEKPVLRSVPTSPQSIKTKLTEMEPEEAQQEKTYLSTHVYAGAAALCFNAGISKSNHHVVMLDAALGKKPDWNWSKAIKFQLNHKELPLVFGVIHGWRNALKLSGHGDGKSFSIKRQEGGFFITVEAKNEETRAVPVSETDAFIVSSIIFQQIMLEVPSSLKNKPELVYQMMKDTQNIKPLKSAGE